jgi:hypothetical protein
MHTYLWTEGVYIRSTPILGCRAVVPLFNVEQGFFFYPSAAQHETALGVRGQWKKAPTYLRLHAAWH